MKAVIQRVLRAEVKVEGAVVGAIGHGMIVFLGIADTDAQEDLEWMLKRLLSMRIFESEAGKMDKAVGEMGGEVLVVSQFTLFGCMKKGARPSFNRAARPEVAIPLYEALVKRLEVALGKPVPTGVFGATMEVNVCGDGPVTISLDSETAA